MKKTKFIPSLKALYKSVELLVFTSLYIIVLKPLLKLYIFYFPDVFSEELTLIYFLLLGILLISFVLAVFIYGFIHQFLWGEPDPNPQHLKFLPANKSMIEACFMFFSSILTTVITCFIMFPFVSDLYTIFSLLHIINIDEEEDLKMAALIIWLTVGTYCYHFRFLISNRKRIPK